MKGDKKVYGGKDFNELEDRTRLSNNPVPLGNNLSFITGDLTNWEISDITDRPFKIKVTDRDSYSGDYSLLLAADIKLTVNIEGGVFYKKYRRTFEDIPVSIAMAVKIKGAPTFAEVIFKSYDSDKQLFDTEFKNILEQYDLQEGGWQIISFTYTPKKNEHYVKFGFGLNASNAGLLIDSVSITNAQVRPQVEAIIQNPDLNLSEVGGVEQTGKDWTPLFENLDDFNFDNGRLLTELESVKVEDSEGDLIDPATEETLDKILKTEDLAFENDRLLTDPGELEAASPVFESLDTDIVQVESEETREPLSGDNPVPPGSSLLIRALNDNVDRVYIGPDNVDETNGYQLNPGENITIPIDNIEKVYVYAMHEDDGVSWLVVQ